MAAVVHAGVKRKPSDLGDHERLAKRFEVLNLGVYYDAAGAVGTRTPRAYQVFLDANGHKHYLPVASGSQHVAPTSSATPPGATARATTTHDDGHPARLMMEVEDTRDRVYIHDLDKELADVESDEEHPIFIPDIDKHLGKLPRRLLEGRDPGATLQDRQLVLYHVPNSISLAQGEDSVRKVLIESRNRARLEQRARIKREQRGDMDVEEPEDDGVGGGGDDGDKPKRVFARLKWKDPAPSGGQEIPLPMHMEDADESTPEPTGPPSPNFTVVEMDPDEDAMDLG